jgi:hypothetical protein
LATFSISAILTAADILSEVELLGIERIFSLLVSASYFSFSCPIF